jgi:hypothetical protein
MQRLNMLLTFDLKINLFGVFLAIELGRIDQICQRGLRLLPLASLETTVWIDPKLLWLEVPVTD